MRVVTGEEMRQVDRFAIEELGMKEEVLMENAGRAATQKLEEIYAPILEKKLAIFIGKGNNGGDGFVIARTLLEKGAAVDVWVLAKEEDWRGAALYHKEFFERSGFAWLSWPSDTEYLPQNYDVVIDAMLGTGISGALRSPYKEAANFMNELKGEVAAIDIPSGVPSGEEAGPDLVVKADVTITLQSPKCSAFLPHARKYYGILHTVDIGLPKKAFKSVTAMKKIWTEQEVRESIPERVPSAHKGDHGKGLLIGGSRAMPGALVLSSSACIYSGAGLLTTALPPSILPIVSSQVPESMYLSMPETEGRIEGEDIEDRDFFDGYDAVAAGPGLGRAKGIKSLLARLLSDVHAPLLLDADALYFLPELQEEVRQRRHPLILTPHPGEMAHLLGISAKEVNQERFHLSYKYAVKYRCYLVLKGPATIVTTPVGDQYVNTTGNVALARGGTGDVLTGIALGMLMQKRSISSSLSNAVYLHGLAADQAIKGECTPYSMAASDLIRHLPLAFRTIVSSF